MTYSIYLRPLQIADAQTSYRWRNNPDVWKLTGSKPDKYITPEMETAWLNGVLKRGTEARFAICLKTDDRYIGNIHLQNIAGKQAEFGGLFIGETSLWGKGIGTQATTLLLAHAFLSLNLDSLYGFVRKEHDASLAMLKKTGFEPEPEAEGHIRIFLTKDEWLLKNKEVGTAVHS